MTLLRGAGYYPNASMLQHTIRASRILIGAVLLVVGGILCVIPGPGIPVVFVGLTVLASEFEWARRLRDWLHTKARQATRRFHGR